MDRYGRRSRTVSNQNPKPDTRVCVTIFTLARFRPDSLTFSDPLF